MNRKLFACLGLSLFALFCLPGCKSVPAHDHLYGAWEITENPTCAASGEEKRTCVVCGKRQKREAAPLPHSWNLNNVCTDCGFELPYDKDLAYELSADGSSYVLTGRGECSSREIVVPFYHEGKPVTEIAEECFLACEIPIVSVQIQNSVKKIGAKAFVECEALESFSMYDSVEEVGNFAFASCVSLKEVRLSKNLTKVDELFYGCTSLQSVEMGGNVREIADLSFYQCGALKELNLPQSLEKIGTMAFSESGLVSIAIPEKVTLLERGLFIGCQNLERVTILGELSSIESDQFDRCPSMKKLIYFGRSTQEWEKISKVLFWEGENSGKFVVVCNDKTLSFEEVKGKLED